MIIQGLVTCELRVKSKVGRILQEFENLRNSWSDQNTLHQDDLESLREGADELGLEAGGLFREIESLQRCESVEYVDCDVSDEEEIVSEQQTSLLKKELASAEEKLREVDEWLLPSCRERLEHEKSQSSEVSKKLRLIRHFLRPDETMELLQTNADTISSIQRSFAMERERGLRELSKQLQEREKKLRETENKLNQARNSLRRWLPCGQDEVVRLSSSKERIEFEIRDLKGLEDETIRKNKDELERRLHEAREFGNKQLAELVERKSKLQQEEIILQREMLDAVNKQEVCQQELESLQLKKFTLQQRITSLRAALMADAGKSKVPSRQPTEGIRIKRQILDGGMLMSLERTAYSIESFSVLLRFQIDYLALLAKNHNGADFQQKISEQFIIIDHILTPLRR
eukprot:TRINITY_DN6539_c0_g2_i1.p1 TRINITY_DN6539_c0_g2~~TRINITY_DN6539_c0_g2_i1.p1  ORF type:complete len:401 (-),score=102.03 TRINITY_DN6539_c0_g2_i1:109-1311(-)